ncbi:MAG: tRNA (N(6)-L-threonylcarbamoyladenosine(37)-C(2))-methylthiotransferase MtaB [Bacteroidota bacterium]
MEKKTVAFHHFGCKVNFAEASSISRDFKEKGYEMADFHEKADIYVISSCIVTAVAEKKCRAAIRQAHKLNPESKIAVIGCFSELKSAELQQIEGVSLILGNAAKFNLLEEIERLEKPGETELYHGGIPDLKAFVPSFSYGDRTRSFLKIQDGCDYYCSYCTIPLARGHSRSDTIANVVENTRKIIDEGIREMVLTGVNIGDFGRNNNEKLIDLLKALDEIPNAPRIRISSIEPDLLNDEIIDFIAQSKHFMPHFHIPLQSGCDRILSLMKRKYNTALYASRVQKIREVLPNACIAADLIVGFPGETEEDFNETLHFIESTDISYLHVFTYSARENTLASKMGGQVQDSIRKKRSEMLHKLSDQKKLSFYKENTGKMARILFESDHSKGFMHGFSENYIKVKTPFKPDLINQVLEVNLDRLDDEGVFLIDF